MNRAKFERANPCPAFFRPSFSPRIIAGNNNQLERRRLPDRSRRALFVGRATPTIENGSRAAPVSTRKSFVSGSTQADPVKRERHGGPRMLTRYTRRVTRRFVARLRCLPSYKYRTG